MEMINDTLKFYGMSQKGHKYYREYKRMKGMRYRCYNRNSAWYNHYGGRGVTICDEWMLPNGEGFRNYIKWVESKYNLDEINDNGLTIDRIDNDKGYSPDNCRFVNNTTQCTNKSNSGVNNRLGLPNITYSDKSKQYSVHFYVSKLNNLSIRKNVKFIEDAIRFRKELIDKYNLLEFGYRQLTEEEISSAVDKQNCILDDLKRSYTYDDWNKEKRNKSSNNIYRCIHYEKKYNRYSVSFSLNNKTVCSKHATLLSDIMIEYNKYLEDNPHMTENNRYMIIPKKYIDTQIRIENAIFTYIDILMGGKLCSH